MSLLLLSLIVISILNVVLGLMILRKNSKSTINRIFSAIIFLIVLWAGFNYLCDNPITSGLAIIWNRLVFAVAFLQGAFLFYFASIFPFSVPKLERLSKLIIIPIGALLAIIAISTNVIVNKVEFLDWGTNVVPGFMYGSFIGFMSITVIGMLIVLIVKYRRSSGLDKYQLKYLFFGFFITASITLTTNLFLPLITGNNQMAKFGPLSMVFLIAFTVYSIVKHRLMDIRIVLKKVMLHIFISLTFLVFILGSIFAVAYFLAERIPDLYLVFTGSFAMVIALLFMDPLRKFFEKLANRYFFTSLYNYQATLEKLATKLTTVIEMPKVIDLIVDTIIKTMGLDRAGVLLLSNERNANRYLIAKVIGFNEQNGVSLVRDNYLVQWLTNNKKMVVYEELDWMIEKSRDNNARSGMMRLKVNMKKIEASLCMPLMSKGKLISIIVLGNKVTGDAYTVEDFRLLQTISNQASVAIENARLYNNMEEIVEDQTREIKDKNLHLEKLLEIRSQFLDIASHQLRTPVSMIRGVLSMIRDGDLKRLPKAKQRQFIENAWQKGAKLDTIINDILAASELDTQKFQVDNKTPAIQLEEVVDKVVQDSQMEAEERSIELKWQPPKQPLPKVRGHANFLEQAITNLVGNALKYTPSTKMAKEARAQREEKGIVAVSVKQERGNIVVAVKDNGIGIPKEEIKKLFDKFVRASNATAMYTDGSGLGLFIVKEIIDGHQGKVWVESEKNKGSTFYVSLPVVD